MINIGKILKQSWKILWNYRVLWLFGILLAITGAGNAGSNPFNYSLGGNRGTTPSSGYNPNFQPGPFMRALNDWFIQNVNPVFDHPNQHIATLIWLGVGFVLFILAIGVITSILRYVSETAAIRMVDEYEQSGAKVGFKQGWKLGWNRRAFRMWVIDLIISLPVVVFLAVLLLLGLLAYFTVVPGNNTLAAAGIITAIGCAFLFIFVFIVLMVFLGLLRQFFVRSAALEGTGISESFRNGWTLFKSNWKSGALMWLVMIGINIGYGILGTILFFLLIPLYVILVIPALIVAAVPAAIAGGLTLLFGGGPVSWLVAGVVALPFFFAVALLPLTVIGSWFTIYTTNVWTLTYREMKALEVVKPVEQLPPATN